MIGGAVIGGDGKGATLFGDGGNGGAELDGDFKAFDVFFKAIGQILGVDVLKPEPVFHL